MAPLQYIAMESFFSVDNSMVQFDECRGLQEYLQGETNRVNFKIWVFCLFPVTQYKHSLAKNYLRICMAYYCVDANSSN